MRDTSTRPLRRALTGVALLTGAISLPIGLAAGRLTSAAIGAILLIGAGIALANERRIDKNTARTQRRQQWLDDRHIHHHDEGL